MGPCTNKAVLDADMGIGDWGLMTEPLDKPGITFGLCTDPKCTLGEIGALACWLLTKDHQPSASEEPWQKALECRSTIYFEEYNPMPQRWGLLLIFVLGGVTLGEVPC